MLILNSDKHVSQEGHTQILSEQLQHRRHANGNQVQPFSEDSHLFVPQKAAMIHSVINEKELNQDTLRGVY